MTNDQAPGSPARDDDPMRPPPRPVAAPGQVSTPDQLPTVEPGEWPAQPPGAVPLPVARTPETGAPPVADAPHPPAPAAPPPAVAPAAPAYPPSPVVAPRTRSLAWLWLTLAAVVVLCVGVATTLVVVRPWDDGTDTTAAPSPGTPQGEAPDATPPAPAPDATPTSPAATGPVTADLNGDGLGDASAVVAGGGDDIVRYDLASTGTSFKAARAPLSSYEDRVWADFDGDGTLDRIAWSWAYGGTLTLTSEDLAFRRLDLPLGLDRRQPFVTLKPGDFDGDGAIDLLAYGATGPRQVSVWVIRNNRDGFDRPDTWRRLDAVTYSVTTLLAADFTGDGRTDVAARLPVQRAPRDARRPAGPEFGYALLRSTGTGFDRDRLVRYPAAVGAARPVVGDFAGDGTPIVLLLGRGRVGVQVRGLRWFAGGFVLDRQWSADVGGGGSRMVGAAVSDIDGDHRDDVVYTARTGDGGYDGFRVLRSTGTGLEPGVVWAETPRCGRVGCLLYFQNGY